MNVDYSGNPFKPRKILATLLDAVAAAVTSEVLDVSDMRIGSIIITGTFVGTVQIEASADDINFVQISTDKTAPAVVAIDPIYTRRIRAKVSAYTSGAVTVKYMGRT